MTLSKDTERRLSGWPWDSRVLSHLLQEHGREREEAFLFVHFTVFSCSVPGPSFSTSGEGEDICFKSANRVLRFPGLSQSNALWEMWEGTAGQMEGWVW